ncbi:hypothetical protein Nm8I071_41870 [Nonomuraea sp. TT08I-71]|nr:hypothetical protein Nm8I071_41870 [Nonomuraea sp. TT08I-71]
MTTVLVAAVGLVLLGMVVGYVSGRGRRRRVTEEDPAVLRAARGEQHRRAAERAHAQHDAWNNGGHGFTG